MTRPSLSAALADLYTALEGETLSVDSIMKAMPRGSFEMLMMVFAFFIALPIPNPPGFSTILVIPIIFLSLPRVAGHKQPWLPRVICEKTLTRATLEKMVTFATPWIRRAEYIMKPRLQFATHGTALRFTAFSVLIMALCIALPFPLTNKVPATCIVVMCIGIMMHDGMIAILSAIIGLTWVFLLAFLGVEGVALLLEFLK
ncbi:MAG: exopolysaccharide biosynthesis protein [Alphaproteobacteria bacterium]